MAEPALASIIQEDIGANPGHPPRLDRHGTFSFDVLDGGCGVITAARLLDGFLGSGAAQLGMIVAADANPSPTTTRGFPFAPSGGALLLSHRDGARGFERFASRTFAEDADLFEASVRWSPHAGLARRGRNVLEIHEAPSFAPLCATHAIEVATAFLAGAGLRGDDVDVLIASQYPRRFAGEVARGLGIPADRVPVVAREHASAHTAGPIAALEVAIASGQLARARHALFVTVGAGISVAVALYRGAP
jgi:3-oxoacyl-[acyl-carrier-protein] synthase-3